jgi:hypothetical protein
MTVRILNPVSFPQSFFELGITACHYENFLSILKPVFLFPLIKISNVWIASHFTGFLFYWIFFLFLTLLLLFILLLLSLFYSSFCLFVELVIINAIQYILFYGNHHIIFQFFLQFLSFKPLLLFLLLLLLPPFLYFLDVFLIFFLEILISFRELALCYLHQWLKFFSRVASN